MEYLVIIAVIFFFKDIIAHFLMKFTRSADKVLSVVEKELDNFIGDEELVKQINEQHAKLMERRKKEKESGKS